MGFKKVLGVGLLCFIFVLYSEKSFAKSGAKKSPSFGDMITQTDYFKDADSLTIQNNGLFDKIPQRIQKKLSKVKRKFCSRTEWDLIDLASDSKNLFSFRNQPGYFGFGVCWWHSRLQRAALYLAYFRPELPPPNDDQALKLIKDLAAMNKVVEIPGFASFSEFSAQYREEITQLLSNWQVTAGMSIEPIVNALSGSTTEHPITLRNRMDQIYDRFLQKRSIVWLKLQVPGLMVHSWLLFDMKPIRTKDPHNPFAIDGYTLLVLDSNVSDELMTVRYRFGDDTIDTYFVVDHFVPYVDYDSDLASIEDAIVDYCKP